MLNKDWLQSNLMLVQLFFCPEVWAKVNFYGLHLHVPQCCRHACPGNIVLRCEQRLICMACACHDVAYMHAQETLVSIHKMFNNIQHCLTGLVTKHTFNKPTHSTLWNKVVFKAMWNLFSWGLLKTGWENETVQHCPGKYFKEWAGKNMSHRRLL